MALQLEQIDTSVIEELVGLKRDRAVLTARLDRMAAESESVSPTVFQRVRGDYETRLTALDERAAPRKDSARAEYVKLRQLLDEVGAQREAALQDQEELEFRQRLGEFEESEFGAKSAEAAKHITGLDRDLAAVNAVRERFLAAFESEDELTRPPRPAPAAAPPPVPAAPPPAPARNTWAGAVPPPAPPLDEPTVARHGAAGPRIPSAPAPQPAAAAQNVPGAAPVEPSAPPAPIGGSFESPKISAQQTGQTLAPPAPPAKSTVAAPPPPAPPSPAPAPAGAASQPAPTLGGTVILTDLAEAASAADAAAATGASVGEPATGGTVIVTFGRLVPLDPGVETAGASEYRVQPFTTIGRTRQNKIQLDAPSVSRRHAQIALTDAGYVVRDLGSENGTYVNGERVTEKMLAEGDHVQFGAVRFQFHAG